MRQVEVSEAAAKLSKNLKLIKAVLLLSKDRPVSEAAREAGISKSTLYKWKRIFEDEFSKVFSERGMGLKYFLILALQHIGGEFEEDASLRKSVDEFIKQHKDISDQSVLIMAGRQPLGVFIPVGEYQDLESISLSLNPKFISIIEASRKSLRENGGIPHDEFRDLVERPE
jgi:transposase-like protein